MISIQFHRGDKLISKAIRVDSPLFNHTSIRVTYGKTDVVYEAHMGERIHPKEYSTWKGKSDVVEVFRFHVSPTMVRRVLAFLKRQEGKKYDMMGIFSFIWVLFSPSLGKWYCSELAAVVLLIMLDMVPTKEDRHQKVSPYELYKLILILMNYGKKRFKIAYSPIGR